MNLNYSVKIRLEVEDRICWIQQTVSFFFFLIRTVSYFTSTLFIGSSLMGAVFSLGSLFGRSTLLLLRGLQSGANSYSR